MIAIVEDNRNKIVDACKKHRVKSLYLFGSAVTGNYGSHSDIDFLIEYHRDKDGLPVASFDYFDFLFFLENLTGKSVDLVVNDAVRNKIFKERIEKEKVLLYAE